MQCVLKIAAVVGWKYFIFRLTLVPAVGDFVALASMAHRNLQLLDQGFWFYCAMTEGAVERATANMFELPDSKR